MKRGFFIAISIMGVLFAHPVYAGGGGGLGGATEWTQLANNSELGAIYGQSVEQVSNQIKQIQNQLKQYEEMLKQGMTLPNNIWTDALGQFEELERTVKTAEGLYAGYGDMERAMKKALEESKKTTKTPTEAAESRRNREAATVETTATIIDQGVKARKKSAKAIAEAQQHSASAVGQMQAVQAANELAAITAQEIMRLQIDVEALTTLIMASKEEEIKHDDEMRTWLERLRNAPKPKSTFQD